MRQPTPNGTTSRPRSPHTSLWKNSRLEVSEGPGNLKHILPTTCPFIMFSSNTYLPHMPGLKHSVCCVCFRFYGPPSHIRKTCNVTLSPCYIIEKVHTSKWIYNSTSHHGTYIIYHISHQYVHSTIFRSRMLHPMHSSTIK